MSNGASANGSLLASLLNSKKQAPVVNKVLKTGPAPASHRNLPPSSRPKPRPVQTNALSSRSPHPTAQSGAKTPIRSPVTGGKPGARPVGKVKKLAVQPKRSSPIITTPQFSDSDDDSDDDGDRGDASRKRRKLERDDDLDKSRKLRDLDAFTDGPEDHAKIIHAADIAHADVVEHGRSKFSPFFTTFADDEDDSVCPTVRFQYPSNVRIERYQLVKPTDPTDFRPMSEISDNMKIVAEFYVDDRTAEKISCPEDGSGLVERLHKYARDGDRMRAGAQTQFLEVVKQYNRLMSDKRKDGTIARTIDDMSRVPLRLVEHIVKNQVYSRTVSPRVNLVRQYEGFSDNVYGELLPKFLSEIFHTTRLKSNQVFVDLGSGVGNCVLQAALETGCEAWGCEMMPNCAQLATLQAQEFVPRCRMWGLRPGRVTLLQDDFLENKELREVLTRADVILINNQAFTPDLNDKLKYTFLDYKEGCQIVSLKPYRDPSQKLKEFKINDPANVLRVQRRDRFSGMVSWTDDPGHWYLHVKDSSELRRFEQRTKRS